MSDDRACVTDPLSYALASLSWSTWRAGVLRQHTPWGVRVPEGHSGFYAVREGEAWLTSPDWPEPMRLQPGDIALTPRGSAHCLLHAPSGEILVDLDKSWLDDTDSVDNGNGHGEPTRVIYGYTLGSRSNASPLHTKLATLVRLRRDEYESVKLLDGLLELVESEERQRRPGWREIVNQLVQLMFYQSLRAFINGTDGEPEHQGEGVQSVVSDPAIGLVVGLLHNQPGDPWTVASLARWINMSRSAFSERFRDVIGQPPLHYLTEVRMARACHMLANTELSVKQIAALVGYESPSSFTNAFKRWNGTSPANYRTATVCQP